MPAMHWLRSPLRKGTRREPQMEEHDVTQAPRDPQDEQGEELQRESQAEPGVAPPTQPVPTTVPPAETEPPAQSPQPDEAAEQPAVEQAPSVPPNQGTPAQD
jgi:hypothetical protein